MVYDRKIKYLDYMENKERCKGAGFAKIEVREEVCNVTIQVSGLPENDCCDREVFLLDEQKEERLGTIKLENGKGSLVLPGLHSRHMGQTGITYENLMGIRIPLGTDREIYCVWREGIPAAQMDKPKRTIESVADKEKGAKEKAGREETGRDETGREEAAQEATDREVFREIKRDQVEPAPQQQPDMSGTEELMEAELPAQAPAAAVPEKAGGPQGRKEPEEEKGPGKPRRIQKQPVKLRESKWQQVSEIYPHIRPFHDNRDYISISPADFILLPEKYYRMANNSFLLHGYYNYEHLILTRIERRGEIIYYIGVPGNFYDREKQVAVMFGFESFECMEEPAKQGEFGYYMMRLEL